MLFSMVQVNSIIENFILVDLTTKSSWMTSKRAKANIVVMKIDETQSARV